METKNAIIRSYRLCIERGFALTLSLDLDYGGAGQAFGGYMLYNTANEKPDDWTGVFITRVLKVVGVENLNDVVGKTIRVEADHSSVKRIGHIVKDVWFNPKAAFDVIGGDDD